MRLIFKNLNVLRSTINAISTSIEIKEIVESAGNNLPNLFDFSSFGVFWKEEVTINQGYSTMGNFYVSIT